MGIVIKQVIRTGITKRLYSEKRKVESKNTYKATTNGNHAFVGRFSVKQKMTTSYLKFKQCDSYNQFTLVCL